MRWRTLPVELLLLAFLGVFLVYPLAYVLPGAASEEAWRVVLTSFGPTKGPRQEDVVEAVLQANPDALGRPGGLPLTVQTFPATGRVNAEQLARRLTEAGGQAEVVRETRWTAFYFQQTLGFRLERTDSFPYIRLEPNAPFLW